MMVRLRRFGYIAASLLSLVGKRLWSRRLLMGCLLIGLIAGVGILSSVPLYADATQNRLLQGELTEAGTYRPPFSFMWRYVGAWNGEVRWDEYTPADTYVSQQAADVIGLPAEQIIRHVSTIKLRLYPDDAAGFNQGEPLLWANVGFVSGIEEAIRLVEGQTPTGDSAADGRVPVLVSQPTADRLGIQVGETYTLFTPGGDGTQLPLQVVGVWSPQNPDAAFWFYPPTTFNEMLLTTEEAFTGRVAPLLEQPVSTAVWYLILDGRAIRPGGVGRLLDNVAVAESRVNALLTGTTLDVSPVAALQNYDDSAGFLTLTLTMFSLPVMGLVLYFITLVAGMVVQHGRTETAIMRSRGIGRGQIMLIYLLEGGLVAVVGLFAGLFVARGVAQMMGRTRTFLDAAVWTASPFDGLVTVMTPTAVGYALLAVALTILALLIPALRHSRHTIVTLRTQQSRDLERPVWQRYFLDFLLLIPAGYGWYQLEEQGTLAVLGGGNDPFANPLLFLVPVLFCFALGLIAIRIFPVVMGVLAWAAEWLPGTTVLITLRQLARGAAQYTGSLLLLTLTLSLATFTASMAVTLDDHLLDRVYYRTGADLNLTELGESTADPQQRQNEPGQPPGNQPPPPPPEQGEARYLFLPVDEHLDVSGVEAAARVGTYDVSSNIGGRQTGRVMGLDRLDFARVAFFRPDFAGNESLGGVLNRLAVGRDYILVDRRFMVDNGLQVGDPMRLTVEVDDLSAELSFVIAAPIDYWPTLYPQDGPFFVTHLDYLHEGLGGQFPYNVWLRTTHGRSGDGISAGEIEQGVRDLGIVVSGMADARQRIIDEQGRPERQGLFGLLSVGFGAAAVLTVLGFLVFAVVSFQQRFIELGMMRAIGLSVGQMAAYLAGEQAALILTGTAVGTGLGVWAGRLFIPFFQVGAEKGALVPPFVVQIAWSQIGAIYIVFGGMFVAAVLVLIGLLLRMKVFEAVKLGETV